MATATGVRASAGRPGPAPRDPVVAYLYILATVVLTVYGQLVVKWRVGELGALPAGTIDKAEILLRLTVTPWMLSVYAAAVLAGLAWMVAVSQLELSRAYPFVGLTFGLVLVASAVCFGEALTAGKVLGTGLIIAGIVVGARL